MTAIHDIPAEVWGKIFVLCCDDGGHTGGALALVSRYIHAVSKPYQYRSVALMGKRMIAKFANLLAANHECRRVKHLFMSTFKPEPNALEYIHKGPLQTSAPPSLSLCGTQLSSKEQRQVMVDMYQILEFIAPSVQYLHIIMGFYREDIFFPIPFPMLEELAFQGPFHDHYDCNDKFRDTLFPQLPSLRRLYLTDVFTCVNDRTFLAIRHYAPYLTHLRIQCADGYIESSKTFLQQLLPSTPLPPPPAERKGGDEGETSSKLQFPETLQCVLLHPGPAQPKWNCGTTWTMRSAALRELERYANEDSRIVLFKESPWKWPYSRAYGYVEGEQQWLDRISGGEGCWSTSD